MPTRMARGTGGLVSMIGEVARIAEGRGEKEKTRDGIAWNCQMPARGVGPVGAASLLRKYGTLQKAHAAGRFAAEAEKLRLYRQIAKMDANRT